MTGLRIPAHGSVVIVLELHERNLVSLEGSGRKIPVALAEHARVWLEVAGEDALPAVERGAEVLDALSCQQQVALVHAPSGERVQEIEPGKTARQVGEHAEAEAVHH